MTPLTVVESQTHFALWCVTSSPLLLSMELTEDNLNLLHEEPQVVKNHKFKCTETNVTYIPSRSAARCIYRSADGKTKYKHVKLIHEVAVGQEELQRAIDIAAAECQQFYNLHHTPAGETADEQPLTGQSV